MRVLLYSLSFCDERFQGNFGKTEKINDEFSMSSLHKINRTLIYEEEAGKVQRNDSTTVLVTSVYFSLTFSTNTQCLT